MSAAPHMEFRLLEGGELELAAALAASQAGVEDAPETECWGLGETGAAPLNCLPYGVFMQGAVSGVLWILPHRQQAVAEVKALVLPRKRWGLGLMEWMLHSAAEAMAEQDMKGLFITLSAGGARLGEKLEETGFHGPQPADPGYPRGRWIKKIQSVLKTL